MEFVETVENPPTINVNEMDLKGSETQMVPMMETKPEANVLTMTAEQKAYLIESAKVEMNVRMIMSNTTYTREEATALLKEYRSAEEVVRRYLGVVKENNKKLKKSVNQEIFRQIRTALNISCDEYRKKNPLQLNDVVNHFKEEKIPLSTNAMPF